MKKLFPLLTLAVTALTSFGLAHGNQPGKAELAVGDQMISITYVAPELKGRDIEQMIQQPGANPWRLGADRPTTLATPVALTFGETKIEAGEYPLRAYLDGQGVWWLQAYSSDEVVAKAPLGQSTSSQSEEHLKISLQGEPSSFDLMIHWGTYVLKATLSVAD